jgi:hypothetical protein
MNPTTISIAIVISAIALVGTAAIAVNYSPAPAHAQTCKGFIFPQSKGTECFPSKKECEAALQAQFPGTTAKCINSNHR